MQRSCVTLLADILASAIVPVNCPAGILVKMLLNQRNEDAVTIPENVAPPYTFKVAPVPTFISDVVVKPDIIRPFETVGAPDSIFISYLINSHSTST